MKHFVSSLTAGLLLLAHSAGAAHPVSSAPPADMSAAALPILPATPDAPAPSSGKSWHLNFSAGAGLWNGTYQYEIGGLVIQDDFADYLPTPLSRLKWPSDLLAARIAADMTVKDRFEGCLNYQWSLSHDAGTAWDQDFEYPDGRQTLFIESSGSSTLDAWRIHGQGRVWLSHGRPLPAGRWSLGAGVGWLVDQLDWEHTNITQRYPAAPEVASDFFSGVGIRYQVRSSIPYGFFCARWTQPRLSVDAYAGYSPIANIKDRDDHLVRGILAETSADGWALLGGIQARFFITPRVFLNLALEGMALEATGASQNVVYAAHPDEAPVGMTWQIDETITATQFNGVFSIGVQL